MVTRAQMAQISKPEESLANFLMVETCLPDLVPDMYVYVLSDYSLGVAFDMQGVACLHQSQDALVNISTAIGRAIGQVEVPGVCISCTIRKSENIDEPLDRYLAAGGDENPILLDAKQSTVAQFRRGVRTPLLQSKDGSYRVQVRMLGSLLTIVVPWSSLKGSFWDSIISIFTDMKPVAKVSTADIVTKLQPASVGKFLEQRAALASTLQDTMTRVTSAMANVGAKLRPVEPDELLATTTRMMYPSYDGPMKPWNPSIAFSSQCGLGGDITIDDGAGYVRAGRDYHRTLSLAEPPTETQPGMLTQPHPRLDYTSITDYLHDGFITISMTQLEKRDVRFWLEDKRDDARAGRVTAGKAQTVFNDAITALQRLDGGNLSYFATRITAVIFGSSAEDSQERVKALRNSMGIAGLPMIEETSFNSSAFWGALPFGHHDLDPDCMREWWFDERMAADILPICTQDRGTRSVTSIFLNRAGEPFTLGFFDTSAGMWTVVGISGTGKSFLCQRIILDWLSGKNNIVYIIDKGGSYRTMIAKLGAIGTNLEVGDTCLNPFEGDAATATEFLSEFLPGLILLPKEASEERGVIGEVLNHIYRRKQRPPRPYESAKDLADLPENVYLHRARKRFTAQMPDAEVLGQIDSLNEQAGERPCVFELNYLLHLTGRNYRDSETAQDKSEVYSDGSGSIGESSRTWLSIRSYEILADGADGRNPGEVWVLATSEARIRQLDTEGFTYTKNGREILVDVETEADLEALIDAGLRVNPSLGLRRDIEARVRQEHAGGADLDEQIAFAVDALTAGDIFRSQPGQMVVQEEVLFSDFGMRLDELAAQSYPHAASLANRFRDFWGAGANAKYFDGYSAINMSGYKIVGFEIAKIAKQSEHLYAAVIGALIYKLMLQSKRTDMRNLNKLWVLDEAWQLVEKSPAIAKKLEEIGREGRKYGIYMGLISQYATDFLSNPTATKLMDAAMTRIFLRQDDTSVEMLKEKSGWTSDECALLSSVRSRAGYFSEFVVEVKGAMRMFDVARYIPTPHVMWLCTTTPNEVKYREQVRRVFKEKGLSPDEALTQTIRWLADNHPHGLPKQMSAHAIPSAAGVSKPAAAAGQVAVT